MVDYQDLYKTFDAPVLAGVSLRVASGESLAILGPSGTGKSVLLKSTIGLIQPDAGDVLIDGRSVFHSGARGLERIRRKVGYVFQNAALFDSMPVLENVAEGIPEDDLRRMPRSELIERVADALEHVNLDPHAVLSKLPSELSGGMRKRVGLARAIVARPEILLYDEPVTGLDPMNAGVVHRLIANLADELGVTSIIVTHDVEGALAIAGRVALLERGHIRFVGTPTQFRDSNDPIVGGFLGRDVEPETVNELETV